MEQAVVLNRPLFRTAKDQVDPEVDALTDVVAAPEASRCRFTAKSAGEAHQGGNVTSCNRLPDLRASEGYIPIILQGRSRRQHGRSGINSLQVRRGFTYTRKSILRPNRTSYQDCIKLTVLQTQHELRYRSNEGRRGREPGVL